MASVPSRSASLPPPVPNVPGADALPLRFWKKVTINEETGCWHWNGAHTHSDYGHLGVKGKMWKAHRYAYTMIVGPIPEGMSLDHLCRNRRCCNPAHLDPVTHKENCSRGNNGINMAMKTHCPQGHAYEGDNVYYRPGGGRSCKTCTRERGRVYDKKRGWRRGGQK